MPHVRQSDGSEGRHVVLGAVIFGVALLVVALLAAVAVTDVREAEKRGRVRRTMADMRSIGVAWENYGEARGTFCPPGALKGRPRWGNLSTEMLKRMVCPAYIKVFPERDAWGRPFQFYLDCRDEKRASYALRSAGRDGIWANDKDPVMKAKRRDYDIVYANGDFIFGQKQGYCDP
jgi:hypothetical protein